MRTVLLLICMIVFGASDAFGQFLQIELMNGPNLCCGYKDANQACIHIKSAPPLTVAPSTALVYTWYAKHENGLKPGTFSHALGSPSWDGPLEVWVVMQYVDTRTRYAFAALKSNAVMIQAHNCPTPNSDTGKEVGG
ncbi:MAG: hypothetical protein IPI91_19405 [Flavobacteriales bacterium]|nr:hypothetical protein [Flavobacteriales bacterium]